MMDERTSTILGLTLPPDLQQANDYLLQVRKIAQSNQATVEALEKELAPAYEPHPKIKEVKEIAEKAIHAASGMKKIIEQTVGKVANVTIPEEEKRVRKAVKELFGVETDTITFEMYKQALAMLNEFSKNIRDKVIDGLI